MKTIILSLLLSVTAFGQSPQALFHANNVTSAAVTPISRVEVNCYTSAPVTGCTSLTGSAPFVLNLGTSTTAGELIYVATFAANGATYGSVTDSATQTYMQSNIQVLNISSHGDYTAWYKCNSAAGVTSVSFTPGLGYSGSATMFIVGHYKGIPGSACSDKSINTGAAGASASFTGASSGTLTQTNELAIVPVLFYGGISGCADITTVTPSGSWSLQKHTHESSGGATLWYLDQIVSSTTALAGTGTSSGTGTCFYGGIDTFKGN